MKGPVLQKTAQKMEFAENPKAEERKMLHSEEKEKYNYLFLRLLMGSIAAILINRNNAVRMERYR